MVFFLLLSTLFVRQDLTFLYKHIFTFTLWYLQLKKSRLAVLSRSEIVQVNFGAKHHWFKKKKINLNKPQMIATRKTQQYINSAINTFKNERRRTNRRRIRSGAKIFGRKRRLSAKNLAGKDLAPKCCACSVVEEFVLFDLFEALEPLGVLLLHLLHNVRLRFLLACLKRQQKERN